MTITIEHIKKIIDTSDTVKAIATISENGDPHVVFKDSLFINSAGEIVLWEFIETSITNKNLVHSIWFGKTIAVTIMTDDKVSYLLKGIPKRAIVSGKEYEKYYAAYSSQCGALDLSTIWIIEITSIEEKTLAVRSRDESIQHPLINHLDRLYKLK